MTEPAKTGEIVLPSEREPGLKNDLAKMEREFAMAAPRGFEARQLIRDVLTAFRKDPKLLECEPMSVLGGAMTMAQLGLRVGVLGHGWLLPFWDSGYEWTDERGRKRRGAFRAQLILGYLGIKELAYRSDRLSKITAHTVHKADIFDVDYGLNERLVHRPATTDRGEAIGYYSTAHLRGASDGMFYYMTHEEALAYRDRYAMARKKDGTIVGPWANPAQFPGMVHKSCFRQLSKWLPLNTDLAIGLAVDESVRVDISPTSDAAAVSEHLALEETPRDAQFPSVADELAGEVEPGADADAQWREQAKAAEQAES